MRNPHPYPPETIRFYLSARDDSGRPPIERCVLTGLDKHYQGSFRSTVGIMLHKFRCGQVTTYIRHGNFEQTRRLPRGTRIFVSTSCRRLSVDFEGALPHMLAYARENGIEINMD